MGRVFANRLGDRDSIPGCHNKDSKKYYLTLSIKRYGSRERWSNPGNGVVSSPTIWCSSYRKWSFLAHLRLWSRTFLFRTQHVFTWYSREHFSPSNHNVDNEKDENHLMQVLMNMVDGVEQTRLNPVFFPSRFLLNVALNYHREAQHFSYLWLQDGFSKGFSVHVAAAENIRLHWAWYNSLKTQSKWCCSDSIIPTV